MSSSYGVDRRGLEETKYAFSPLLSVYYSARKDVARLDGRIQNKYLMLKWSFNEHLSARRLLIIEISQRDKNN